MRVSTQSIYLTTARGLGGSLERVQEQSVKLSTGKQINNWSDDAPGAASAEAYRSQEADWSSFDRSGTDAKGWLDATDGTLQSMSSLLTRLRGLAISVTNGGLSGDGRTAIAEEVRQLRSELRDLGQTQHLGRSLFGGFGDDALETADDGTVSWSGDDGVVKRQISPTVVIDININGRQLFGFDNPDGDVFATLSELESAARGEGGDIGAVQTRLLDHAAAVGRALARTGATTNQVTSAQDAGASAVMGLAARRSELEDVDIAEAVLKLKSAEAGYQAALGAAAKANLPSLAEFLR